MESWSRSFRKFFGGIGRIPQVEADDYLQEDFGEKPPVHRESKPRPKNFARGDHHPLREGDA